MKASRRLIPFLLLPAILSMMTGCIAPASTDVEPQMPETGADCNAADKADESFLDGLSAFSFSAAQAVLSSSDGQANALVSPISLYYALSLAAQGAQGETQRQLLDVLSIRDSDTMADQSAKLFRMLYMDEEKGKLLLANSVWQNKSVVLKEDYRKKAVQDYFASLHRCDFSAPDTAKNIARWVNEHTGGKLGGKPGEFAINPADVLILLNTVHFKARWFDQFSKSGNTFAPFHRADGTQVNCEYLNTTEGSHAFAQTEDCTASALSFDGDWWMLFVLPNEGVSPCDIASDPQRLKSAICALSNEDAQMGEVVFAIPKFSYGVSADLTQTLKKLGVTAAFDPQAADFSAMSDTKPLFIGNVKQSAAICVDEYGVEAAAYTKIEAPGAAPPNGRADMILDRPFLFAIMGGAGNAPLFIGIVNDPTVQ